MSGYLEGYGAEDARREKKARWIVLTAAGALVLAAILYFTFRNYKEERQIGLFLEAVRRQDYKAAYVLWGCLPDVPCRDYPMDRFLEDWGPQSASVKVTAQGKLWESERCGTGFIGVVSPNSGKDEVALWVERSTGVLGFAPYRECPEAKFRLVKWLKMKFGSTPPPSIR